MTLHNDDARFTRRKLLQSGSYAGLLLASSDLLAACGTSGGASNPSGSSGVTPRKGGHLTLGIIGNGTGESYDPALAYVPVNGIDVGAVFDPLNRFAPFHRTEPGLALEWNPNKDATSWEIKLRPNVVWHDGKPFTAEDVIYTFRSMGKPGSVASSFVNGTIDLRGLKKLSDLIVEVPLTRPYALLPTLFTGSPYVVIQDGATNFSKPIGTGPFRLESFTPGKQSILVANKDYWDHPRPYLDRLEIISITDDSARLNALVGGQIDIASPVPAVQAKANLAATGSGWKTVVSAPGVPNMFTMRVDKPPFTDDRVRLAMKLIADRPGLIEAAFSGFAAVGNDLVGLGFKYYDSSLPQRHQDIEQAKSLLSAAGQSNLHVTLQTSNVGGGVVEAATAFAEQAKAAGVSINVQQEPASSYFNSSLLYTKMTFAQSYWTGLLALGQFYDGGLASNAIFPETHWSDPAFDSLLRRAEGTLDPSEAQALWNQLQEIQYNKGGYLVWGVAETTHGIGPRVAGFGGPGSGWSGWPDEGRVYNWGVAG